MSDTISNKQTNSGDTPPAVDDQTADGVITAASVVAFMPNANKVISPEKSFNRHFL